MNIKIKRKNEKEVDVKDFIVGKLYNYYRKDSEDNEDSGIILVVYGNTLREKRILELFGDNKLELWSEDAYWEDFVFTEFSGSIEISNE